jgi:4-amino-4-deoxy-L-arabinose transferase-like glycosyltransferase
VKPASAHPFAADLADVRPYPDALAGSAAPMTRRIDWDWPLLLVLVNLYIARIVLVPILGAAGVGLHVDEAQYWHWSHELEWGYYSKPPGIALLIALSTAVLGDGLLGVKALAMACYPATAWVLGQLAREMTASTQPEPHAPACAGRLAALLFITSPLAGLLGLAATTDAPLLLAWTLAMWALWRALQAPPQASALRSWLMFGLALGAGALFKYTMVVLAASVPLLLWVWRDRPTAARNLRGATLAAAVSALVVAPNLWWNHAHGWPTLRHTADITLGARSAPAWASVAEFIGGQWMMLGPLVVLVRLWSAARWRRPGPAALPPQQGAALRFALYCALPLLCVGVAQAWHARAQINWTAPAITGLVLWLALWLTALRVQGERWAATAAWASGLTSLALATAVVLAPDMARGLGHPLARNADVWSRMRGWDAAFEVLRAEAVARPGATVIGADRTVIAHGAYAWRDLDLAWTALPTTRPPRHHYEMTAHLPTPGSAAQRRGVLLLGREAPAAQVCARFTRCQELASAHIDIGPGQTRELHLWEATP